MYIYVKKYLVFSELLRALATITGNQFYKSNDAVGMADQLYATKSVINTISSSNAATLISNLTATNTFQNVNNLEDFFLA